MSEFTITQKSKKQNNHSGYSDQDRVHGEDKAYTMPTSQETISRVGRNCKGVDGISRSIGDKDKQVADIFKAHSSNTK